MKDSKRLEPVARLSQHRERDAARELGKMQNVLEQYREKLRELQTYRDEYLQRYQQALESGRLQASPIQDYRCFLERISAAIDEQRARVEDGKHRFEQTRQSWLQTRVKANAIDKVITRQQQREHLRHDKREQHEADEHAAGKHQRKD